MNKNEKSICFGIIRTAAISILVNIVIYLNAYFYFDDIQLNLNKPFGFAITLITSLVICFIWLGTYWFMDSIQREPIKMMLYSFFTAFFVHFCILSIVNKGISTGSKDIIEKFDIIKEIFIPMFSINVIFSTYIKNLNEFDEPVDSLIYGGFVGIGICLAECLLNIFQYDIVSLKFVTVELISKVMIYSSVCAFSGYMLNKLTETRKNKYFILTILSMFIIFSFEFIIGRLVRNSLKISQNGIVGILFPLFITIILFVMIAYHIAKIILNTEYTIDNKDDDSNEKKLPENKPFHKPSPFEVYGYILFLLIVVSFICILKVNTKTKKIITDNKQWEFFLPESFNKQKVLSINMNVHNERNVEIFERKYSNGFGSTIITFNFDDRHLYSEINELYFSPQKTCQIFKVFIDDENTDGDFLYLLRKNGKSLYVNINENSKDEKEAEDLIRIIAQNINYIGN